MGMVQAAAVDYAPGHGALGWFWVLIAIPLLSAAILLIGGRRTDRFGHWVGVLSVAVTFVIGLIDFFALRGLSNRSAELNLYSFASVGNLKINVGLLLDPLSALFVLLITGVGLLIHIYAVGYMEHDPGRRKFFGYFNLFVAAMLLLVLAGNYVMLYVGWEGVGLASYLLIAFWFDRPAAATAGKKAFLMNRVGDAGLLLAIFLMFANLGTVSYSGVFSGVGRLSSGTVLAIGLFLLLGATGKSGQFPLQAWLPDAMEGPTPVSALIHAATMVTAGVYLIARSAPIFNVNATAQLVVTLVGVVTLLIGAIIGCAKDDIKRVLAYSTMSQIGYMFLGVGLGGAAYALAIIHLLAHGFFKAGLFLGAGSVMHGMHDQTDIRRFGNLWRFMKITWFTTGFGALALMGIPPFSGFFTKDPIIEAAFNRPGASGWVFGSLAAVGAGLTGFYMTRMFILTFHGSRRWTDLDVGGKPDRMPHESPLIMTVPLVILAVGSLAAGFILSKTVPTWLSPLFGRGEITPVHIEAWQASTITVVLSVAGLLLGWFLFRGGTDLVEQPAGVVVTAARRNLYADAVNKGLFELPGKVASRALVYFDNRGLDGLVNGLAATMGGASSRLRRTQTGFVRSYAVSMLGGALLVVAALLVVFAGQG